MDVTLDVRPCVVSSPQPALRRTMILRAIDRVAPSGGDHTIFPHRVRDNSRLRLASFAQRPSERHNISERSAFVAEASSTLFLEGSPNRRSKGRARGLVGDRLGCYLPLFWVEKKKEVTQSKLYTRTHSERERGVGVVYCFQFIRERETHRAHRIKFLS